MNTVAAEGYPKKTPSEDGTPLRMPREESVVRARELKRIRVLLTVLIVLTVLATLRAGRAVLIPVALGVFFAMLLSGWVEHLRRWKVPRTLASALVMAVLFGLIATIVHSIVPPGREWLDRAPSVLRDVETKVRPLQRMASQLGDVAERAERVAGGAAQSTPERPVVASTAATTPRKWLVETPALVIAVIGTFFLTFFLLAFGPVLLAKLGPREGTRSSRVLEIARGAQHETAQYLATIALINVGLGLATAGMTALFGLPTPLLWGVVAATLNFVPYAGSAVTLCVLTIVALLTLDGIGPAIGVAASYLGLATLEGQLVQPLTVGRRLSVSPLIIFLALWFWGWLWGVAGMVLATPFLIAMKAVSCQVPAMSRLTDILSPSSLPLATRAVAWRQQRRAGATAPAVSGSREAAGRSGAP
jgi:predicted PurR-regulated permease PerM